MTDYTIINQFSHTVTDTLIDHKYGQICISHNFIGLISNVKIFTVGWTLGQISFISHRKEW